MTLEALLEEQSITGAAKRLNISQPAVSIALAKLREWTGDRLLVAEGRGHILTARGISLRETVKDLLTEIDSTLGHRECFDPATASRSFYIGMSSYSAAVLGRELVGRMESAGSGIRCVIREFNGNSIEDVWRGALDFCVVIENWEALDREKRSRGLKSVPLFQDRYILVSSKANFAVLHCMSFEQFARLPYVATHFGDLSSEAEHCLDAIEGRPVPRACVPTFEMALKLVESTDMVAIIPSMLACRGHSGNIRVSALPFEMRPLKERLLWHSRNERDAGHLWCRELLQKVAEEVAL